jgi:phospholipid/cholesterol/gamma-HCH transport system substrate-binding protein
MARTPVLERPASLKILGAAFIAVLLFFLWLTYAFFNQKFVSSVPVTMMSRNTGVNLPQNADVKLRGVIVGEVRKVEADGNGVKLTLAMNPKLIKDVPKGVTAELVPKTLFGEKYVSLIPPATVGGPSLRAGDVIEKADVPIEVETLLDNLYPLLDAVDPANLSYTLSAISTALDGRGEKLGTTLVTLNSYLQKTNPDVPQLIDDLNKLGTVSDGYAKAIPDLGRLLRNTVVTGNTIVAKKSQLAAFFQEGTALSDTLTDFTKANGDNLKALAKDGRPVLDTVAEYAPTFPCFLKGMTNLIPRLDSVFRGGTVHINLMVVPQPTAYKANENLVADQSTFDDASKGAPAKDGGDIRADNAAAPTCLDLNKMNAGDNGPNNPYSSPNPPPDKPGDIGGHPFTVPPEVYKLVGVKSSHNKFGPASAYNRSAASSASLQDLVQPSMSGIDSAAERSAIDVALGGLLGMQPSDVPDIGSLLVSPIIRGSDVVLK